MEIKTRTEADKAFVTLVGRLDTNAAVDLTKALDEVLAGDVKDLTLDMVDCNYVASSGLRVILNAQKTMNTKQGTMVLKNVSGDVMEVFDMTGFSDILTFA